MSSELHLILITRINHIIFMGFTLFWFDVIKVHVPRSDASNKFLTFIIL